MIFCHLQIVVANSYAKEKTIVETTKEGMLRVPLVFIERLHTFVTPSTDCFIGSQFLRVEKLAQETRSTAIDTVNVRITIGTSITSYSHIGVALIEEVIGINSHICLGIDGLHVQVTYTRAKSQAEC